MPQAYVLAADFCDFPWTLQANTDPYLDQALPLPPLSLLRLLVIRR